MQLEEIFTNATAPEADRSPMPPAMLVFAHPDDESIAVGGRLGRFREAHLVHVTDGAPRNEQDSRAHGFPSWREYRDARAEELTQALQAGGTPEMSRECFGFADQEASLHLVEIAELLVDRFRRYRPIVVFTHPYEGGHPDHDACAFAVHHAAKSLEAEEAGSAPLIVEAAFYNGGSSGLLSGDFLPSAQRTEQVAFALMREELERKHKILACFTTQQETLRGLPVDWERFRVAPEYDFTRPPDAPRVLYESFPWGMTSSRFCELARQAEDVLHKDMAVACR